MFYQNTFWLSHLFSCTMACSYIKQSLYIILKYIYIYTFQSGIRYILLKKWNLHTQTSIIVRPDCSMHGQIKKKQKMNISVKISCLLSWWLLSNIGRCVRVCVSVFLFFVLVSNSKARRRQEKKERDSVFFNCPLICMRTRQSGTNERCKQCEAEKKRIIDSNWIYFCMYLTDA